MTEPTTPTPAFLLGAKLLVCVIIGIVHFPSGVAALAGLLIFGRRKQVAK